MMCASYLMQPSSRESRLQNMNESDLSLIHNPDSSPTLLPAQAEPQAEPQADPEKNQARYNLRRRKDDGEAKAAETEAEEKKEAKLVASPPVSPSPTLDFGGKIGRLISGDGQTGVEHNGLVFSVM